MIKKVNTHETKTHLSRILAEVENGMEVIICRAGKPIARIIPENKPLRKRTPGSAKNVIRITEDFDASLPDDILDSWTHENTD